MGVAPRERHGNEGPKVETGDAQASSTPTEPTRIRSRRAGLIGQPVGRVTRRLPGGEIPPGPPLVAEETLRTTEWSGHAPPADFGPCGRSRTPERERSGRARNGRRGAAAVTQNQLPTRSNPSKGQAHGSLPRTIRGGPTARCGAPTTDAGSTRRTPDLVPAATCWRPEFEDTVEVVETTRTVRAGRWHRPAEAKDTRRPRKRERRRPEPDGTNPERPGRGARRRTRSSRRGRTRARAIGGDVRQIRPEHRRRRNG